MKTISRFLLHRPQQQSGERAKGSFRCVTPTARNTIISWGCAKKFQSWGGILNLNNFGVWYELEYCQGGFHEEPDIVCPNTVWRINHLNRRLLHPTHPKARREGSGWKGVEVGVTVPMNDDDIANFSHQCVQSPFWVADFHGRWIFIG